MFFILSKLLSFLLKPIVIITLAFIVSLFVTNLRVKKALRIIGLALLLFFSNEFVCNEVNRIWEYQPIPLSEVSPHTVGIVLTGITSANREPHDRVYINYGADRVLHAIHLYRLGKIKKILVTGGEVSLIRKVSNESEDLIKVFLLCGVKREDIIQEGKALNTRENAAFSKIILDSLNIKDKPLLITSAYHMRRAHACFEKVGLETDPFPVNFFSFDRRFSVDLLFIPSESAIGIWATIIHEVSGYIIYKIMGYC